MKIKSQPSSTVVNSQLKQRTTQKSDRESFLSLKGTILAIQQSQEEQGITSLAATLSGFDKFELGFIDPDIRERRATIIGHRCPVDWDDFWYLDRKLYDEWGALSGTPRVCNVLKN